MGARGPVWVWGGGGVRYGCVAEGAYRRLAARKGPPRRLKQGRGTACHSDSDWRLHLNCDWLHDPLKRNPATCVVC